MDDRLRGCVEACLSTGTGSTHPNSSRGHALWHAGRVTQAPAELLPPLLLPALLRAPAGSGGGEGAAEVWRRLCREALKAAFSGPRSKLVDAMAFERPLVVLDRLTVTPRMQQCLVGMG